MKRIRSNLLLGLPLHRAAGGGAARPAFDGVGASARQPDKKAVLVVSFGTSYNQTRAATIDAIEAAIARKPKGHDFVIERRGDRPAVGRHMSVTGG